MKRRRSRFPSRTIAVALASLSAIVSTQAFAESFLCTPSQVAAFNNRVHVRCTAAAPNNISFFAVCSDTDPGFASRALSIFTTAKVTAKNITVFYTASDTSGASCGCLTSDCRLATGAVVMQ